MAMAEKKKYRCKGCGRRFKSIEGRSAHKQATGHSNSRKHPITAPANVNALFGFVSGYTECNDDLPDGAFFALCEEAVMAFNADFGTDFDWFDVMGEYIDWCNKQ